MSTHAVNIVEIGDVLPHPNASRLEIVPIGQWQAIVKKGEFKKGDRAVYIEPDYMVPTDRPEFSFLAKANRDKHRLKAVRLRGELSFGLLIPVPAELAERSVGDNVMEELDIQRWEPVVKITMADEMPQEMYPSTFAPKFDIESLERFPHVIAEGEQVFVTEKIHGANARYTMIDGIFYMGSRNRWLYPDGNHVWARAIENIPGVKEWCKNNERAVLYGEAFGDVQSLKYGRKKGEITFAGFAACSGGLWMDQEYLFQQLSEYDVPHVPILHQGSLDIETIKTLAEQDSVVSTEAGHMMEGVVICPQRERWHASVGRVALKHISNRYWLSND